MNTSSRQMSEAYRLGVLLTLTGGFLDTYTYMTRGGVFANAQTGNIVLLAIHLARGQLDSLLLYLIPVLAYALGVVVAEIVKERFRGKAALHWRQVVVFMEFIILFITAFIPEGAHDSLVNVAISFVCAMQVEAFRKIRGNALATTMCTGNLRSGTELLYHAVHNRDRTALKRSIQYYGIILCFIAGAAVGVWASLWLREFSILICCALLAVVFAAMFFNSEKRPQA